MQRDAFIASRRPSWERLQVLVNRVQHGGLDRLTAEELFELGDLYRQATSDLAIIRRDFPGDRAGDYLNGLIARAHPALYRERPVTRLRILRFILYGYPATFRAAGWYIALAFGV